MIASTRITERKWKPDLQHNRQTDNLYNSQTDDLRARFKVPECRVFYHTARLRDRPPRLKLVLSDNTGRFPRPLEGLLAK